MNAVPGSGHRPSRVIALGASAGGVEALRAVAGALPAGFPAALVVVLHVPATGKSLLAPILDRDSALDAHVAAYGMTIRAGNIYVAPPDRHVLVQGTRLALHRGPKENGVRPAVDPLFRSVARTWGSAAVAVVLSGALDDGASGVVSVAEAGGTVVVQDPADALVPGMPSSALAAVRADHVLPLSGIARLLERLAAEPAKLPAHEDAVTARSGAGFAERARERPAGAPTGFTCPECSGAIWVQREGELLRYRCRVGHTYNEEAFVDGQASSVEAALWAALEVLEERAELLDRVARRIDAGKPHTSKRLQEESRTVAERAELIRRALMTGASAHEGGVAAGGEAAG